MKKIILKQMKTKQKTFFLFKILVFIIFLNFPVEYKTWDSQIGNVRKVRHAIFGISRKPTPTFVWK